jgi:hypothetical protein
MAKPTPEETRSLSLDLETLGGMESSMVYTVQYRALSYKVWRRLYPVYIYDGCITRVHTRRLHLGYMQGKNDILFFILNTTNSTVLLRQEKGGSRVKTGPTYLCLQIPLVLTTHGSVWSMDSMNVGSIEHGDRVSSMRHIRCLNNYYEY